MNIRFLEHFGSWGRHFGFVVFTTPPSGIPIVGRHNPLTAFIRKCSAENTSCLSEGVAEIRPCESLPKDNCVYFCDVSQVFLTEQEAKQHLAESVQHSLNSSQKVAAFELAEQARLTALLSSLMEPAAAPQSQQAEPPRVPSKCPKCNVAWSVRERQEMRSAGTESCMCGYSKTLTDALVPMTERERDAAWIAATIELPSQENCYKRGLVDSEAHHGIKP